VLAGVRGPRSLELSGRIADGMILAWPLTGPYIAQAHEAIDQGRQAAGRTSRHQLAGGTPVSVDPDPGRARDAVRAAVAAELAGPTGHVHIEPLGIAGDLTHCAHRIASLAGQGIEHVILSFPAGITPGRQDTVSRQLTVAVAGRLP
jgi:5,10-methylenetetrahydromethanopterin reductase